MALIGEMQYLTIGDKTYSLPSSGGSGTVTSVNLSNASNGGLTITGGPITSAGSITVGHSNVLASAQTTQAVYPIKIDKNGHISEYGSAVTIPVVPTNVSAFTNDAGYLTSYTEADPVFTASAAHGISSSDITNWNKKSDLLVVGSGNYSGDYWWTLTIDRSALWALVNAPGSTGRLRYINVPSVSGNSTIQLELPTSAGQLALVSQIPTIPSNIVNTITTTAGAHTAITSNTGNVSFNVPTKTSHLTNDSGFITGYTETDPVFSASVAAEITSTDITNWNNKTSNTGTVTSVGLTNNTNGGLSISGSPVTTSGSITIGHSNVLSSAQTTSAVYPIKIDKNGHISEYGTAVTSMPASDVSAWAKAATKPSYNFSEIGSTPTSISGYGITDAYTKSEVDGLVSGVLHYKGTKATVSALPSSGNITGDVWHVTADGSEWAWDDTTWQELGTAVDLSGYVPTSRTINSKALTGNISLTASDVGALPSSTTIPSKTSDLTNDSGFITSYTDEKLKTTTTSNNGTYYFLFGNASSTAETKYYSSDIRYSKATGVDSIQIGQVSSSSTKKGRLTLTSGAYYIYIDPPAYTSISTSQTYTLPATGGTIALTSDIPTISYPVTSVNTKTGAVTLSASDVGAATSDHVHGNITNGGDITATAPTIANGDQIIINDNSASKITNGPTFDGSTTTKALTPKGTWESFSKSDTNTTYTLSNALSSHKFTETLTAGGSGSGTSTATLEFAAGTGITLTDDTTNKKITIASSVVNTDTKVTQNIASTSAAANYRLIVSQNANDTPETTSVQKVTRIYVDPSTADIGLYTSGSEDLDTAIANLNWDTTGSDGVLW